jgi:hypothetical protein
MKLINSKVSSSKDISKSKRISEFIIDETLFKVGLACIGFDRFQ